MVQRRKFILHWWTFRITLLLQLKELKNKLEPCLQEKRIPRHYKTIIWTLYNKAMLMFKIENLEVSTLFGVSSMYFYVNLCIYCNPQCSSKHSSLSSLKMLVYFEANVTSRTTKR